MSITNARREEVQDLERKINAAIAWVDNKKVEIQAMIDLVSNVPRSAREQMSRSASSSTRKKGRGETIDIDDTVSKYEGIISEMRIAIERKQQEVESLKKEKRDLEEYEQGI